MARMANALPLSSSSSLISLEDYIKQFRNRSSNDKNDELCDAILAVSESCIEISNELLKLPLSFSLLAEENEESQFEFEESTDIIKTNVQGEIQKPMDIISNNIMIQNLQPIVAALASEEEEKIVLGNGTQFEIAFDPLDGSSNLDINIPTGTIFGIAPYNITKPFSSSGRSLVAAGYTVYSSSTELVLSIKNDDEESRGKVASFVLVDGAFYLSRSNIRCPPSGSYYSLNEAREPDWPDGLKKWIYDSKRGRIGGSKGGKKYSSRYVCSLCADFHRTLLKGGWAGNPRPHLRLLYEAAPLAFLAENAGGLGSDGINNLLDIQPTDSEEKNAQSVSSGSRYLHYRTPVFLGSRDDIHDLVYTYGDVQQRDAKKYDS